MSHAVNLVIEGVKGDEFMLEDDGKVESLNFKSILDELLEGLAVFEKENLRINKTELKRCGLNFHTLLSGWPRRQNVYKILVFNLLVTRSVSPHSSDRDFTKTLGLALNEFSVGGNAISADLRVYLILRRLPNAKQLRSM